MDIRPPTTGQASRSLRCSPTRIARAVSQAVYSVLFPAGRCREADAIYPRRPRLHFETLEPRLMLAADLLPIDLPGGGQWQTGSAQPALFAQQDVPLVALDVGPTLLAGASAPLALASAEAPVVPAPAAAGDLPGERQLLAVLEDGLERTSAWADRFDQGSTLHLPLVKGAASDLAVGQLMSSRVLFTDNLWAPLQTDLSANNTGSLDEFVSLLRQQSGVESATLDRGADEYVFNIELTAQHTSSAILDLGSHALTEGFRLADSVSVDLTTTTTLTCSFGISLADDTITAKDFFLCVPTMALSVKSDLNQKLDFALGFGFLALQVSDAVVSIAAELTGRMVNPDGDEEEHLTFDELASADVSFDVGISGEPQARLPVEADFLPFGFAPRVVTVFPSASVDRPGDRGYAAEGKRSSCRRAGQLGCLGRHAR